jgi:hypothetical protein
MIAATPHANADAGSELIDIVVDLRDERDPSRSSKRIVLKDLPRPRSREEIVARLAGYADGGAGESVAVVVVRDVHRVVVCEDTAVWRKDRIHLYVAGSRISCVLLLCFLLSCNRDRRMWLTCVSDRDTSLVKFYDRISRRQCVAPPASHVSRNEREESKARYVREWSITHGREAVDVKGLRVRFYRCEVPVNEVDMHIDVLWSRSNKVPGERVYVQIWLHPGGVVYWVLFYFQDDDDGYTERPNMESCKIQSVV